MHAFYIFAFAFVQRNCACFTCKGALEIQLVLFVPSSNTVHDKPHKLSIQCVARDLGTMPPRPRERVCVGDSLGCSEEIVHNLNSSLSMSFSFYFFLS